ncbi:MAG: tRNA pseudouridine(55) synthase TruB [Lachnospiraceae bacterium]|nr:tRNA pseudouridine(55) synthase TruB [Lachnospiraceae bacterium]
MDGIINIYKERGFTSHDVVAKLRGILHQKKIGHTGTLDPEAQGVLPVCLGKATRVCDLLADWDKEYRATMLLGITTDTQDMTGTVLTRCPFFLHEIQSEEYKEAMHLTSDSIRSCIESFIGENLQIPPMYSALKVNGKKLYELARQGVEVERKPRAIRIYDIQIENIAEAFSRPVWEADFADTATPVIEVQMIIKCSKGTYIRTICHDIGQKLGCGGCMSDLLRTEVGPFDIADSLRLSEIENLRDENRLDECVCPTDFVFSGLEAVELTTDAERFVRNGNPVSCRMMTGCRKKSLSHTDQDGQKASNRVRLYGENGEFLAVYEYNKEKNDWRARKMFL